MDTYSKFEPIFFTPPLTKWDKRLYKGGGGDGGAAARQAAEDARVAAAVQRVNEVFGLATATPNPIDRNQFTRTEYYNPTSGTLGGLNGGVWEQSPRQVTQGMLGSLGGTQQTRSVFDQAAYDAAVAAEQARIDKLKNAAQGREQLYTKIGQDTTNNLLTDLTRERDTTQRELNFDLARKGLTGGSRDVDASKDVLDTFLQGKLKATNLGLQQANSARVADDNTRTDLITKIRAGLDEGNAIQQSYEGMRNNASQAQDAANQQTLQGFFSTIRNELDRAQYQQGINQAQQQYGQLRQPTGARSFNGNVTNYGGR